MTNSVDFRNVNLFENNEIMLSKMLDLVDTYRRCVGVPKKIIMTIEQAHSYINKLSPREMRSVKKITINGIPIIIL